MKNVGMLGLLLSLPLAVCNAQTNKVDVSLTMPGHEMLFLEMTPIVVSLSNGSNRVIPIIKDAELALKIQIKFSIGAREPYAHSPISATDDSYKKWHYLNRTTNHLNPGETFFWSFPRFTDLTVFGYHVKATNITANILIGDDEWVRSETLPFSVSEEDTQGAGLLEKGAAIECYDSNTRARTGVIIRKVKLGDKNYLFTNEGARLCELPEGETPEPLVDSEKGVITVSFSNSKRSVRYDLHQKKVLPEGDQK